jgi:hypothetical protein
MDFVSFFLVRFVVFGLALTEWVLKFLKDFFLEMLEKKENVLSKKAVAEVEKAKEFTRAKIKKGKSTCGN